MCVILNLSVSWKHLPPLAIVTIVKVQRSDIVRVKKASGVTWTVSSSLLFFVKKYFFKMAPFFRKRYQPFPVSFSLFSRFPQFSYIWWWNIFLNTGFETQIFGVGNNHCANCATAQKYFLRRAQCICLRILSFCSYGPKIFFKTGSVYLFPHSILLFLWTWFLIPSTTSMLFQNFVHAIIFR